MLEQGTPPLLFRPFPSWGDLDAGWVSQNRGTGLWGAVRALPGVTVLLNAGIPQSSIPWLLGSPWARGSRCCWDTVLSPGPSNRWLHPDLCIPRYQSPPEPPLQRILRKQALIPGVSPGLEEQ